METQEVITSDGLQHAQSQLEYLYTVGRANVAQYLYDAKESGDVIDNAASEDAKNQQAHLEGKIQYLEQLLAKAKLISKVRTDVVYLDSVVHVQNSHDREYRYRRVV